MRLSHKSANALRLTAAALACGIGTGAEAEVTASYYHGGGELRSHFQYAIGWSFIPSADILVTHLGVYDHDSPGFLTAHAVGLFERDTRQLLAQALVGEGTSSQELDGSRFMPVPAVALEAGVEYYLLGSAWQLDQYAYGDEAVSYAPGIEQTAYVTGLTHSIHSEPIFRIGPDGLLGPNFRFIVPAPAAASILAPAALAAWRRRR